MTYEYVCTDCGHGWEAEQSISAAPLKTCPHCHHQTAKRQVSGGAGFILKGGGWYADGYGSKGNGNSGSSSSSGSSGSAGSSSSTPSTSTSSSDTASKPDPKPSGDSKASGSQASA